MRYSSFKVLGFCLQTSYFVLKTGWLDLVLDFGVLNSVPRHLSEFFFSLFLMHSNFMSGLLCVSATFF